MTIYTKIGVCLGCMGSPCTRTQINQIEKVQRRAARYVTNRYHNTSSVTDMLQNLNWPSLEIRRTRVRLIMFYKIIHHVVAIHPLDTLLLPTTTITRYNSSHTYQHIRTDKDSYSRTPLIRPPSESHWCGRIRGMVAREGFVCKQKPLSVTRNVVV